MKISKNKYFINIAKQVATKSKCERLQVGAVIIDKDNRIISTGYNGSAKGTSNPCEENNKTLPTVIHAEENAILFAKQNLQDCIIYCTHSPCLHCAAKIIQCGITKVYFLNEYRSGKAIEYLRNNNIKVLKMYYE